MIERAWAWMTDSGDVVADWRDDGGDPIAGPLTRAEAAQLVERAGGDHQTPLRPMARLTLHGQPHLALDEVVVGAVRSADGRSYFEHFERLAHAAPGQPETEVR